MDLLLILAIIMLGIGIIAAAYRIAKNILDAERPKLPTHEEIYQCYMIPGVQER